MVGPISINLLRVFKENNIQPPKSHAFGMTADLVNGLLERGHEVDVFTLSPGGKEEVEFKSDSLRVFSAPTRFRMSALKLYSPEIFSLRRALADSGKFDIIHSHWLYEYSMAALTNEAPTLVTVHDWPAYVLRNDPSLVRLVKFILSKRVIPMINYASAPSGYMVEIASDVLKIRSVDLIPNALPSSMLLTEKKIQRLESDPILIAINNGFSPRKNVSTLLDAMPRVRRAVPNARLRLVGSGYGEGEDAHRYAARKRLIDGVEFVGQRGREEVLTELTGATAFVHPSKEESFGLVLAEAMARQTPVIAGRNSGAVPWILEDGKSGALCDVESAEDLANTIIGLLTSPERRAQYIENGLQRVKSSFLMEQMITRFENLYERISSAKH